MPLYLWAMNLRPIILDRYIFREFVLAFVAVMGFCALLLLVASIFDRFSEILEYGAPMDVIVVYFLSALPGQLIYVIPIASMLAVLFSVGSLARTNEVLAMLTGGVHALRLALPIIFGGVLIMVGAFFLNEYVVPHTERTRKIYDLKLEDRDIRQITMNANVFTRGRDGWIYLARVYSNKDKKLVKPTIVDLNDAHSRSKLRIEAASATFLENDREKHESLWRFDDARVWKFDNAGNMTTYTAEASTVLPLEEDLPAILAQQIKPEEMNYQQLKGRIKLLKTRNQPVADLQTDLLQKLMFPLGILIIMMIGFSFAVKSRAGTAMAIIGYGISWAVGFFMINTILQALGRTGTIPPFAATVVPAIIFAGIAAYMMRRSYQWHA